MATRTHTSFQKRQKELARMEKQREKAARRLQRKLAGKQPEAADEATGDAPSGDRDSAAGTAPAGVE